MSYGREDLGLTSLSSALVSKALRYTPLTPRRATSTRLSHAATQGLHSHVVRFKITKQHRSDRYAAKGTASTHMRGSGPSHLSSAKHINENGSFIVVNIIFLLFQVATHAIIKKPLEGSEPPHARSRNECSQAKPAHQEASKAYHPSRIKSRTATILEPGYSLMPHLLLHSALPIIAPVPTAGMLRPASCVFNHEAPKPAWMISCGTLQSAGKMLSVPVSSLLSALTRSAGSQSVCT